MIKLIVDGAADFTDAEVEKYGVEVIPIKVRFGEKEYEKIGGSEFYKKLKESKNLPTTSLINEQRYAEAIGKAVEGGNQALVMCLSSRLSGSFNSLQKAAENFGADEVAILDTGSVAGGYKILALEAIKMIEAGLPLAKIAETLETLKSKLRIYAVIDDVTYLIKGGRMSVTAGVVVSALNIKPVVTVEDGKVKMCDKVIGFKRATAKCASLVKNLDASRSACFFHCDCEDKLQGLKSIVSEKHKFSTDEICCVGPVVGTHVGGGCIGFTYFEK